MYSLNKYVKDTIALTRSLVIKVDDIAIIINNNIANKTGVKVSPDRTTWKYYLNLSGKKHKDNNTLTVVTAEDGSVVELTAANLDTYSLTRDRLISDTVAYTELLAKYPDDTDLVKGAIYPVDIDTAIDAADGTILNYNHTLVQQNELSLLRYLEMRVGGLLGRWYVKEYNITDPLYMASVIGTLYQPIPSIIMDLRLRRANTQEAHAFHIEHFFRSRLDLWDSVSILPPKVLYWLYANFSRLMQNIGKNETLDLIIDKIFTASGVGIGRYNLSQLDPVLSDTLTDLTTPTFSAEPGTMYVESMNDSHIPPSSNLFHVDDQVRLQLSTLNDGVILPDTLVTDIATAELAAHDGVLVVDQPSKLLDISTTELTSLHGNDRLIVILDNWLYTAANGQYVTPDAFVDPNTEISYNITPMQGLLWFYRMAMRILGTNDVVIENLYYSTVIDSTITKTDIVYGLHGNDRVSKIVDIFYDAVPTLPGKLDNPEAFRAYVSDVLKLNEVVRVLESNVNDVSTSMNLKHIASRLQMVGSVPVSAGDTIDNITLTTGLDVLLYDTYDTTGTMEALFKHFTNMDMDEYTDIVKVGDSYLDILNKLTSYTIQVVRNTNYSTVMRVPYSHNRANIPEIGIINVTEARIDTPYELDEISVTGVGVVLVDTLGTLSEKEGPAVVVCDKSVGTGLINTDPYSMSVHPGMGTTFVEVSGSLVLPK